MQVYVDKKLMGNLNLEIRGRNFVMALAPELPTLVPSGDVDFDAAITTQHVTLPIEWASFSITESDIALNGPDYLQMLLERHNVPLDADRVQDMALNTVRFRWKIINCPEENFEELFEHPDFEPV